MTERPEDLLRRLLTTVTNAGEAEAASHLIEHLTATVRAHQDERVRA